VANDANGLACSKNDRTDETMSASARSLSAEASTWNNEPVKVACGDIRQLLVDGMGGTGIKIAVICLRFSSLDADDGNRPAGMTSHVSN
jgi:hypothetical protein